MVRLNINGKDHDIDVDPNTPLLWAIRENVGLTGTKYGCGIAQCGACTVHVDGVATRSCSFPVSGAVGTKVTTIEGLDRSRRPAVRLLPVRPDHGGGGAAQEQAEADRRRYRPRDDQHLPLRHLPANPRGDSRRGKRIKGGPNMNFVPKMNRRSLRPSSTA